MMNKKTFLSLLAVSVVVFFHSCENDNMMPEPEEFVAGASDFAGFMNWTLETSNISSDSTGSPAHGINDPAVLRDVYVKEGQDRVDGEFPIGTMIVKHSRKPNDPDFQDVFTAMVKRGGDFNPNDNGWEWFMINADGSIIVRTGDDATATSNCSGCHNGAANDDFVFTK